MTVVRHRIRQRTHDHSALTFIDYDVVFVVDRHQQSPKCSGESSASSIAFTEQLCQFAADVAESHGARGKRRMSRIDKCDALWSVAFPSAGHGQRGGIERLGAGVFLGSRCRLRHRISAVLEPKFRTPNRQARNQIGPGVRFKHC